MTAEVEISNKVSIHIVTLGDTVTNHCLLTFLANQVSTGE